jgi:hypothetical protein
MGRLDFSLLALAQAMAPLSGSWVAKVRLCICLCFQSVRISFLCFPQSVVFVETHRKQLVYKTSEASPYIPLICTLPPGHAQRGQALSAPSDPDSIVCRSPSTQ